MEQPTPISFNQTSTELIEEVFDTKFEDVALGLENKLRGKCAVQACGIAVNVTRSSKSTESEFNTEERQYADIVTTWTDCRVECKRTDCNNTEIQRSGHESLVGLPEQAIKLRSAINSSVLAIRARHQPIFDELSQRQQELNREKAAAQHELKVAINEVRLRIQKDIREALGL